MFTADFCVSLPFRSKAFFMVMVLFSMRHNNFREPYKIMADVYQSDPAAPALAPAPTTFFLFKNLFFILTSWHVHFSAIFLPISTHFITWRKCRFTFSFSFFSSPHWYCMCVRAHRALFFVTLKRVQRMSRHSRAQSQITLSLSVCLCLPVHLIASHRIASPHCSIRCKTNSSYVNMK